MNYVYKGDSVILPTGNDPAIRRVTGHHRFHIGLDLGQSDPTAIVIIEDRQYPIWADARQTLEKRQRSIVYADRVLDTRYVEIARHAAALTQRSPIARRWTLTVDATGVGRAFVDVLADMRIEHMPVQMVGGTSITQAGRFTKVAKNLLITSLAGAFETQQLTIAADLPLRNDLMTELESFSVKSRRPEIRSSKAAGQGTMPTWRLPPPSLGFGRSNQAAPMARVSLRAGFKSRLQSGGTYRELVQHRLWPQRRLGINGFKLGIIQKNVDAKADKR